jgi:hypothetical protein
LSACRRGWALDDCTARGHHKVLWPKGDRSNGASTPKHNIWRQSSNPLTVPFEGPVSGSTSHGR